LSIRERVNVIELSAIKQLLEKFVVNKQKLIEEYKIKDIENTGAISLTDWIAITGQVLELKLPWRSLRYFYSLAPINFSNFLLKFFNLQDPN